ncbi:MAG: glycoside hydrolase/phage tail family protein [Hyphomicrobiaceae bacterium]|nr:glycoside hydrolase/phage tail family protein [Hyphomicrobiaceae bacterium]
MATLALTVAGAAVGSALLPAGVTLLGATISGAVIGSQVGALAGTYIDQVLLGPTGRNRALAGPRLSDLAITTSTEGAPIPRLFGRARLGGQVIWATDLEEEAVSSSAGGGGKGAPAVPAGAGGTEYRYYANLAVAICEGPVTGIGRVWADGEELDLSLHTWRLHPGTEDQVADSLIASREGPDAAPAYRGVAYIVLERLALERFGNRLPQLSFEVHRSVDPFERQVRAVVMIPGSGEFAYAPDPVSRATGSVSATPENTHTLNGGTDWQVALDQLADVLPNARSTSLVVSWFGTDLRAGHCEIRPAVDATTKDTSPLVWSVAGLTRASAALVSAVDGQPAYGGTPSDQTVVAAIGDLKARGHKVLLTPFILMDIPAGNTLPDPYTGSAGQPAFPWRGRVTCDPAPGRPGSPDKSAAAEAQLASLVGTAAPSDFSIIGGSIVYTGPSEWSLRRMVLHYATLAVAAGGVDAIVIGSELRGLTQVRSAAGVYPFVAALATLASDVKSIVGPATKVTYAADWSEYFGHHPDDASGDVHFHLDPLWASAAVDAVAIDCYWPLSDWRDGEAHLDRLAGARSIYDLDYLKGNLVGGEGFDWHYASPADRDAQLRMPIADAAGKPWVFRYKDIRSWWSSLHYDRPAGIEQPTPTAWVPQSKPVWLTEVGCPAVDKGANQPNVFVDPKSSESFLPHFSRGERDDLMQRRYLQAVVEGFDPDHPHYVPGANPVSTVYGGRMLDLEHVHVYAWDARPYPVFPGDGSTWADASNWPLGHWVNGRIASQPLDRVVASLLQDYGFTDYVASELDGLIAGLVVDRPMSAREALQPLELTFFLDAHESGGLIRFRHRGAGGVSAMLVVDDLVEERPGSALLTLTRAQESELPSAVRLAYSAPEADYRPAVAQSRRLVGGSGRVAEAQIALVLDAQQAFRAADTWLFETWAARERARIVLPPSALALEPGDVVALDHAGRTRLLRITGIGDHGAREIEAMSIDPEIYDGGAGIVRKLGGASRPPVGPALGLFLDLPLLTGNEPPEAGYVAAARVPWPGGIAFYRSPEETGYTLAGIAGRNATVGVTLDPLAPGPESRLDRACRLRVRLDTGALQSSSRLAVLAGANAAALLAPSGTLEVLQFETAALVAPATYELSTLLRAQAGTEDGMRTSVPAGARFVLLDGALSTLPLTPADIGLPLNWRFGPTSREIGDASYVTTVHAFSGRGLLPLSPVHIRSLRDASGNLAVTWVRRTRVGGDSWNAAEVPIGEEAERYEVDILDGPTVVRTIASTVPAITYTAADQTADFGAPQPTIPIRVAQVSASLGRGTWRGATV